MADSTVERECMATGVFTGLWCLVRWEEAVSRELVEVYRLGCCSEEASGDRYSEAYAEIRVRKV